MFIISCQDRQKKEECLLKHFPLQSYLDRKHVLLARPGSCSRTDAMFLAHIFVIYPCYRLLKPRKQPVRALWFLNFWEGYITSLRCVDKSNRASGKLLTRVCSWKHLSLMSWYDQTGWTWTHMHKRDGQISGCFNEQAVYTPLFLSAKPKQLFILSLTFSTDTLWSHRMLVKHWKSSCVA